jgi:hypothetical protein
MGDESIQSESKLEALKHVVMGQQRVDRFASASLATLRSLPPSAVTFDAARRRVRAVSALMRQRRLESLATSVQVLSESQLETEEMRPGDLDVSASESDTLLTPVPSRRHHIGGLSALRPLPALASLGTLLTTFRMRDLGSRRGPGPAARSFTNTARPVEPDLQAFTGFPGRRRFQTCRARPSSWQAATPVRAKDLGPRPLGASPRTRERASGEKGRSNSDGGLSTLRAALGEPLERAAEGMAAAAETAGRMFSAAPCERGASPVGNLLDLSAVLVDPLRQAAAAMGWSPSAAPTGSAGVDRLGTDREVQWRRSVEGAVSGRGPGRPLIWLPTPSQAAQGGRKPALARQLRPSGEVKAAQDGLQPTRP